VFWSPDSRHVAFFANGELRRVDIRGGAPTRIAEAPFLRQQPHPGTWSRDDVILVSGPRGLMRVAASGGALAPLTRLDEATGEQSHAFPLFLPDGRHFLYTAYRGLTPAAVYVSSLDAPDQRRKVIDGGSNVQFAAGALLFMRGNTLVAQSFDPRTLTLSGEPAPIADNLLPNVAVHFGGAFSTSATGALVYQAVGAALGTSAPNDRLVWRTRTGQEQALHDIPSAYRHVDIAPDGRRAVVSQLNNDGRGDLWTIELARGVPTRITFTGGANAAV